MIEFQFFFYVSNKIEVKLVWAWARKLEPTLCHEQSETLSSQQALTSGSILNAWIKVIDLEMSCWIVKIFK